MKILGIILILAAAVCVGSRPALRLEPLDWSVRLELFGTSLTVATQQDLLVHYDGEAQGTPTLAIRRRNEIGGYDRVANFSGFASPNPIAATNGRWVAVYSIGTASLFYISEDNIISNETSMSTVFQLPGQILSDDTYVAFQLVPGQGSNRFVLKTYTLQNGDWQEVPGTALELYTFVVQPGGAFSSYRIFDRHFLISNYSEDGDQTIEFYERQEDLTWSLTDKIPVVGSGPNDGSVLFNGIDTIAYTSDKGVTVIFTKNGANWTETQRITPNSVGLSSSDLGFSADFLDPDTLLLASASEGATSLEDNRASGKVLMLTRNKISGVWEPAVELIGYGVFGVGLGVNAHDILVASASEIDENRETTVTFHTISRCFNKPVNVTCHDQSVSDCADLSTASLYTINNPQCGKIDVNIEGLSLIYNQGLQAQIRFVRSMLSTLEASCNVTVTCPAPPAIASLPPITVPIAPSNNNLSGGHLVTCGLLPLFLSFIFSLL